MGVVLIDISAAGARIEHYNRVATGTISRIRFQWEGDEVSAECRIVSCKVHRFSPGDDGLTVYQSGLLLTEPTDESALTFKKMVTAHITRALAEQVANARGVVPVFDVTNMPIFTDGMLTSNRAEVSTASRSTHLIPQSKLVSERGFICCTLQKNQWQRRWTQSPVQPEDGFTLSANEQHDQINKLCEAYGAGSEEQRQLIRTMAEMSIADQVDRN